MPPAGDPQILAFDPVRDVGEGGRRECALGEHGEPGDHRRYECRRSSEPAAGRRLAPDLDVDTDVHARAIDRRLHEVERAVVHRTVVEVIGDEPVEVE